MVKPCFQVSVSLLHLQHFGFQRRWISIWFGPRFGVTGQHLLLNGSPLFSSSSLVALRGQKTCTCCTRVGLFRACSRLWRLGSWGKSAAWTGHPSVQAGAGLVLWWLGSFDHLRWYTHKRWTCLKTTSKWPWWSSSKCCRTPDSLA